MWFNALVALLVLIIPVIWSTKAKGFGVFSAFLAAVCSVAAGGVAFALWEPVSYMILGWGAGASGFFGSLLEGSAFGLGLAVSYLVPLLIFRLLVDSLVPANLDFSDLANTIGGGLFGVITSVISIGILVLSVGFLRLTPGIMGYAPLEEKSGQLVYTSKLWIPVDAIVVRLYEGLSTGGFSSSTPLRTYHPDLHIAAAMQRITYGGSSRNTAVNSDFEVLGAYSISGNIDDLARDDFIVDRTTGDSKKQQIIYPDGSTPSGSGTLYGYPVRFKSGAKEKIGNIIVTPGQMRLVVVNDSTGEAQAVHPVAVVAPPDATTGGLYRFRFDAPEGFISSLGGGSDAVFAFEFIVPQGSTPTTLFVKNWRVNLRDDPKVATPAVFGTYAARDKEIKEATIFNRFGASIGSSGPLDKTGAEKVKAEAGARVEGIEEGSNLPDGMLFSRNNKGSLTLNGDNQVVEGDHTFAKAVTKERGLDKNLRVERFATGKDVGIVKVNLSVGGARSLYGRSVETAESILLPLLVDDKGVQYEPVGFYYAEGDTIRLRYVPGEPLRSLAEAPALSKTKRDQTLILIFRPTKGAKIVSFALGSRVVAEFSEPIEVKN